MKAALNQKPRPLIPGMSGHEQVTPTLCAGVQSELNSWQLNGGNMTQSNVRKSVLSVIALFLLLIGIRAFSQGAAGFDLTLIDVEGNRTILGVLPRPLMRHASHRMASA
jgi:hypothetical protein